jgi:biopolymer transport protein ExbB/TolQ
MINFILSKISFKYITIALVILVVLMSLLYQIEKTRHKLTAQEFASFKQELLIHKQNAEAKIKLQRELSEKNIANIVKSHQSQLESIKNEYNRSNQKNVNTINSLRNSLRQAIGSRSTLSKVTPDTKRTTTEWADSYATLAREYNVLEQGCKITTIDYNALRDYADNNCLVFGCE